MYAKWILGFNGNAEMSEVSAATNRASCSLLILYASCQSANVYA